MKKNPSKQKSPSRLLKRISLPLLIFIFVASLGQLIINYHFARIRDRIQLARDQYFENETAHLKADQMALSRVIRALQPSTGSNAADAGAQINPLLSWSTTEPGWRIKDHMRIPNNFWGQTASADFNLYALTPDLARQLFPRKDLLNFSWLSDLRKFSFWDLEKNSPESDLDIWYHASFLSPHFDDLRIWADLRLTFAVAFNDFNAVEDVIHLARLTFSNELLSSEMEAFTLLEKALHIRDHFFPKQKFNSQNQDLLAVSPLDARLASRFLGEFLPRLMYAHSKFLAPFFSYSRINSMSCAMINTSASLFMLEPLRPWWTQETLEKFLMSVPQSTCRIQKLRETLAKTKYGKESGELNKAMRWNFSVMRDYTDKLKPMNFLESSIIRILFLQQSLPLPWLKPQAERRLTFFIHGWGYLTDLEYSTRHKDFFNWYLVNRVLLNDDTEVKRVILMGADIHAVDPMSQLTVLALAQQQGKDKIVQLLREAGAKE